MRRSLLAATISFVSIGLASAATKTGDTEEATTALTELERVWKGPVDKRPKVVAGR